MKGFNRNTATMPKSGIRLIFEKSITMKDVIHLEVGQPDFRAPEHVLEAVSKAAKDGFTQYTSGAGMPSLTEAIARKVCERNGLEAAQENIVVSPGGVCSMYSALLALVAPGEEIMLPDPTWPNYIMQVACLGAKAVRYPLDPARGFQVDFDALEDLAGPNTKVIVVNSPGNPTGAVFSREDIERLVDFARRKDLYLISDEVYEDIVFEGEHVSAGRFDDEGRVVSVFSFSKSYAVTGLRIGYSVAEHDLAQLIFKIQEPLVTSAASTSQAGCLAALTGPQDAVAMMTAAYRQRRDAVIEVLKRYGLYTYTPNGAFYILIDASKSRKPSEEFAMELLERDGVAVAPGETFGSRAASYVRVCFAVDIEQLVRGVEILCQRITGK